MKGLEESFVFLGRALAVPSWFSPGSVASAAAALCGGAGAAGLAAGRGGGPGCGRQPVPRAASGAAGVQVSPVEWIHTHARLVQELGDTLTL